MTPNIFLVYQSRELPLLCPFTESTKMYVSHAPVLDQELIVGVVTLLKTDFSEQRPQYACISIANGDISDAKFFDDKELAVLVKTDQGTKRKICMNTHFFNRYF